jgi:hypothetical protein
MVLLPAGTGHATGTEVSYNPCSEARITPDFKTSLHDSIDLMQVLKALKDSLVNDHSLQTQLHFSLAFWLLK